MIKIKSIRSKILLVLLSFLVATEIVVSIVSYANMHSLIKYSEARVKEFGEYLSNNTTESLLTQSEKFLESISEASATLFNETLENINRQVCAIKTSTNSIISNSSNFKGSIPPLPDMSENGNSLDRSLAFEKAYVVDPNNSDDSTVLVYDPGQYPSKFENNIYRTSLTKWLALSEEERENIQNTKSVVSNNLLPSSIKNELMTISNIFYTIMPIYKQNTSISAAYVATESGIFYKYAPDSVPLRFDPRERAWYMEAVNNVDSIVWQTPYVDKESSKLCITCSKAYLDSNGKISGVVACDMFLSQIKEYILDSKGNGNDFSFIISSTGNIIMHPDYDENDDSAYLNPLESDIDSTYRNAINNMIEGKTGTEQVKINDKEYYLSYSPISETGWSFGKVTEMDTILKPINDAKSVIDSELERNQNNIIKKARNLLIWIFITFIACLLTSFSFSVVISEKITKPIKKLKENVKKIGNGDLSVTLTVDCDDEIGELALAFSNMTKDLDSYIKELSETISEKEKIKSELSIAKKIQLSMLPCIFPAFPERDDFDIYALTDPAKEVGGDFYDFFFVDDDNLAVAIADVSGKGISSALFMVISKILIKNQLLAGKSPKEALEIVNNQLFENNKADMFVTAFIGLYNIRTGEFIFSNAGHNPPFLYRSGRDTFEIVKMNHGFVLAGLKDQKYKNYKINLSENDILFMYTDGVTEASHDNELFSASRLKNILNSDNVKILDIQSIVHIVKNEISKFYDGNPKLDDITIMALKIMKKLEK